MSGKDKESIKGKKLTALLMGAALAASLLLAGCSDSNETVSDDDGGSSSDKTELTITYPDAQDDNEAGYMHEWIMKAYEGWDKKDEYEVKLQPVVANDSDYFTKIQTQMQDPSTSPDLFFEDTFQLNTDVPAGYVSDITSYTEAWDEWDGGFVESLKEGVKGTDGRTYAVPVGTDVRGMWYNKDVFEAAGLDREWQPESWQEILDACEAIRANCEDDVVPIWMACTNSEATTMNTFLMLLHGTGESLIDEASGTWNIYGDGVADSLEFLKTCKDNDYIGVLSEVFDANNWEYANSYMATGKLGIYLNGSWGYSDYLQNGSYPMEGYTDENLTDALGFAQMPDQNGGGYTTMSGGWSWAIAENSDNKDAAFDFLTELMKSDNYITYLIGDGCISVKTGMTEYEEYKTKPYVDEAMEMTESAYFRPHNEDYTKVSGFIYEMVDNMMRNGTEPDTVLSEFQNNVVTVVGEDKTE